MASAPPSVIVLGAGVVGVATAYALARRGHAVTLVDRAAGPAQGASFANGAQLSYVYSDPLAAPALLAKLPGLALGRDPAFRLAWRVDPEFVGWIWRFLRNCGAGAFKAGTLAGLELGLESRAALHALLARHPIDFAHRTAGKMHLQFSAAALAAAGKTVALKQSAGAEQQVLDAAEARRIEPALAGARGLAGAIYTPAEEVGDPLRFSRGLLAVLERDYGVRALFGFDVSRIEADARGARVHGVDETIAADAMVVAAGIDAPRLLRPLGIRVPVMAMKGYSFTAPAGSLAPEVSITDPSRRLVFCRLDGAIRVAGLAELGARDARVDPARLAGLIDAARASLPEAAAYDRAGQGWAGLRPMTPSSLPIVARAGERLFLNIGHGALGWTFAMGTAERTAALLT